jgi:sugar lactone lactonase YvrE
VTVNDFSASVTYTVEAEDGTTQDYVVSVELAVLRGGSVQGMELNLTADVSTLKTCATFSDLYDIASDGTSLYVADYSNHTIRRVDIATGGVTTLAGLAGNPGTADGIGSNARFTGPYYLTTDGTNVFVCDNNYAIRKIVIATGEVTTFAGKADESSHADGTGTAARFEAPHAITNDGTYLYLLDYNTIRRISIASAAVTTLAGSTEHQGWNDGTGSDAWFDNPRGITITGGNLYVADTLNYTIRKVVISTGQVTTIAGSPYNEGSADGTGSDARFHDPWGIATDGTNLYVADRDNETIRKIVISTAEVSTFAGQVGISGYMDGTGTSSKFDSPHGICCSDSILYLADRFNYRIRRIGTSDADVRTFGGSSLPSYVADGLGYPGVGAVATDGAYLYFASANCTIQQFDLSTGDVTAIAGRAHVYGSADGTGTDATFYYPSGITTDGTDLYVVDSWNCIIRKIDGASGDVTTVAGQAMFTGSDDGNGSAARFSFPSDITTDGTYLYVVDRSNHTIRKINPSTQDVSTLAGSAGSFGSTDGTGNAARFNWPHGITTDGTNLYVTDGSNHTIRKIVISTALVSTLAGLAESAGSMDGAGSSARFKSPNRICTDGIHLYITDGNHTIRKLTIATAVVTTPAGAVDIPDFIDGIGSSARFTGPGGITTDGFDLYVADGGAIRIVE